MNQNIKVRNRISWKLSAILLAGGISLLAAQNLPVGKSINRTGSDQYLVLPLAKQTGNQTREKTVKRYGVPFAEGNLRFTNGSSHVKIGCQAKRIFLLGMTESAFIGCWADPTNEAVRFFIGDDLGQIRLNYRDGSSEVFPLVLGENIWWGRPFYRSPGPFPTDVHFRKALASALRLYPPAPVKDGNYVAVITTKPMVLRSITISSVPDKRGTPRISGITAELPGTNHVAGAISVSPANLSSGFEKFVQTKSLRPLGWHARQSQRKLNRLRLALYSSDESFFKSHVEHETPPGYSGPEIKFNGNLFARVLANAFEFNVQDMVAKIDPDGMYHTSTKGALLWGYNGGQFGTYTTNVGCYYSGSWGRDLGRSLQELTVLGYTNAAERCADYCLRMAKRWEKPPAPKVDGKFYPPHWSRIVNHPQYAPPYENDSHGLITMFLYKLWQRLPDRDTWLRARWPELKAAGNWILWQFAHPEISGATNGILHTTGECAHGNGYSVYADVVCMDGLRALAQMADSIGETNSARQWCDRANKMQKAITRNYIINDPKYGRVWTLKDAGWPDQPTVLGPLIFQADFQGFAPQDNNPAWHSANEAAYQCLIDTYKPFGFYGWAMGYGQGFVTQSALLLDRMLDATRMLDWMAKEIYDPRFGSFVVPEGVQLDPNGRFWYRAGDLGNGVQEAEIVKALCLVIGVDDTCPHRLQFYPRMPYGWKNIAVEKYPVLFEHQRKLQTAHLRYHLERSGNSMKLEISADKELGPVATRLGPFAMPPKVSNLRVNGKSPAKASVVHSGDSWWVKFTMSVGPVGGKRQ